VNSRSRTFRGREWHFLVAGLVVTDLLTYLAALVLAGWLTLPSAQVPHSIRPYGALSLLVLPVVTFIFASQALYSPQSLLGGTREYAAVVRGCSYALVALIIMSFAIRLSVSVEWVLTSWLLSAAMVGMVRFGLRRAVYMLRRRGLFTTRALLVGADAQSVGMARQLMQSPGGTELVGLLDDYLPVGTFVAPNLKVLGSSAQLAQVASRAGAEEVIVVPHALPWESLQVLLGEATGPTQRLRIHLLAGFYDLLAAGVQPSQRNGVQLLTVKKTALTAGEGAMKRMLDYTLATALLIVLAPLLAIEFLGLAVRGGPLLERRPVLGRGGKPFNLLSLPSRQVTRFTFLQKLPSLINVLAGQLSVVGPSPQPVGGEPEPERQGRRFFLKPGLTGLWRQARDPGEQALLDLYYIRSYSIWLDLHILYDRLKARLRHPASDGVDGVMEPALLGKGGG
jgi:lipopolysaccharide/colanic/teichoic acid biosynthesis glycosyltransferase